MKELVNIIVQKTGITQENAQKAAQATIGFLKTKLPGPFATQLDSFLNSSELADQAGGFLKGKVGELVSAKA